MCLSLGWSIVGILDCLDFPEINSTRGFPCVPLGWWVSRSWHCSWLWTRKPLSPTDSQSGPLLLENTKVGEEKFTSSKQASIGKHLNMQGILVWINLMSAQQCSRYNLLSFHFNGCHQSCNSHFPCFALFVKLVPPSALINTFKSFPREIFIKVFLPLNSCPITKIEWMQQSEAHK